MKQMFWWPEAAEILLCSVPFENGTEEHPVLRSVRYIGPNVPAEMGLGMQWRN